MGRPKGVKRFPKNLSLSRECITALGELSEILGKPQSRVAEDIIMLARGSIRDSKVLSEHADLLGYLEDLENIDKKIRELPIN